MINITIPKSNVPTNARRFHQVIRDKVYVNTSDSTVFLVRNAQDDTYILLEGKRLHTFGLDGEWLAEWLGENGYSDSWELTELTFNIEIK